MKVNRFGSRVGCAFRKALRAAATSSRSSKGVHSAGFVMEAVVTVTYPFHPLVGQPVFVVGRIERGGVRHFIIRRLTGGSKSVLREWMTLPEAGEIQIVSRP